MGCDWYTFISVSGVGFRITEKQYQIYKNQLGYEYGALIFGECYDENTVETHIFIYDKETLTHNQIGVPGPYEIECSDNCTEYTEQKHMKKFFQDQIAAMEARFGFHDDQCSYWLLLTTMYIGEFEAFIYKEEKYHTTTFSSVKEYREYGGYDEVRDDEGDGSKRQNLIC